MGSGTSELLRLFRDHIGLIPLLMVLLCFAGACIWQQRGRIQILLERLTLSDERLRLMEERKLFIEEKKTSAEKELEYLLRQFGPVTAGFPRLFDGVSNTRHTILLVEDERAVHIYKPALEETLLHTEIQLANNGIEALARIGRQPPDLIITDWLMPEMLGCELLAQLSARYPSIPVLVVSAYIDSLQQIVDTTNIRNLRLAFLSKPFLLRDLLNAIHRLTDNRLRLEAADAAAA